MNPYQNYITKKICLEQDIYPCYADPVYKLEADQVADIYAKNMLPDIRLERIEENSKPKIAIILAQDKHQDRVKKDFTIHPAYVSAIVEAGGFPVFFAYDRVNEVLENYQPQGILLIGGFFYSPKEWYIDNEEQNIDLRGQAYLDALIYAKQHGLPVLGICAGMQMLGGFCGAKLKKGVKQHLVGGDKVAHKVIISEGSLLAQISGVAELAVNSHHSEAIVNTNLGDCILSAQSDDGVVEGIELKNPWSDFVLGVQWHPERNFSGSEDFREKLFAAFVNASGKIK